MPFVRILILRQPRTDVAAHMQILHAPQEVIPDLNRRPLIVAFGDCSRCIGPDTSGGQGRGGIKVDRIDCVHSGKLPR